jgi:hypothetical protein
LPMNLMMVERNSPSIPFSFCAIVA